VWEIFSLDEEVDDSVFGPWNYSAFLSLSTIILSARIIWERHKEDHQK
jgi:hypothetical protein